MPPRLDFMGPDAPGGSGLSLLPVPVGSLSAQHLLVGGSGGGGGASNAAFAIRPSTRYFSPTELQDRFDRFGPSRSSHGFGPIHVGAAGSVQAQLFESRM